LQRSWRVAGTLALLCLIWGSTWLVIRVGLADLPPFTAAAVRFAIAAAAMTIVAPRLARAEGGERPGAVLVLVVGGLNFGVSYAAVYLAERDLPSGLASCLWATYPMMIAAAGHLFLPGEKLNLAQAIGFLVGFAGVVLLFATDVREIGPRAELAACILLVSPLSSTVGTTWLKRNGARTSSVLLNRNAMWVGAALLGVRRARARARRARRMVCARGRDGRVPRARRDSARVRALFPFAAQPGRAPAEPDLLRHARAGARLRLDVRQRTIDGHQARGRGLDPARRRTGVARTRKATLTPTPRAPYAQRSSSP
jgi:uncharacterized membrane protein